MDERQPLLSTTEEQDVYHRVDNAKTFIVEFGPNDTENPLEWPRAYKLAIVALLAFMAFTTTATCISIVPVAAGIVQDLDHSDKPNKSASVLLVTTWELGEAAGPLLIGPLSELFGRRRVLNAANCLFILATVLGALCQSTYLLIATRCLNGLAVAANVLNPAIIGDIYMPEQRGSAMSIIMLAPLLGEAFGPAIAGALAETFGWRSILWMSTILATCCTVLFLCCFRETYKVVILRRRAEHLRHETGSAAFRTIFDVENSGEKVNNSFWPSIARPFYVLFGSGVLQAMTLLGGMTYTYFYILSISLPDILEGIYGLSPSQAGFCFASFSFGSFLSTILCNLTLDRIYVKLRDANKVGDQPEYRLPLVILGSVTLPLIVTMYGWVAQTHLPLPVLLVFVSLLGTTLLLGYLPLMSYVVDALGLYSASGMTALIVIRCLMGTFFPLTTAPLVERFGYGWGFTVLGGISLAVSPIPMLVFRYGGKWRLRSEYTRQT